MSRNRASWAVLVASVFVAGVVAGVAFASMTSGPTEVGAQIIKRGTATPTPTIGAGATATATLTPTGTATPTLTPTNTPVPTATATPQAPGRLIELGTQTVGVGQYYESPMVDIRDCARSPAVLMAQASRGALTMDMRGHWASPDGVATIGLTPPAYQTGNADNGLPTLYMLVGAVYPFYRFQLSRSVGDGAAVDITAWLWCAW